MIHYVIPARTGSKGLPGKNKKLFQFTARTIPQKNYSVYVTSDDEYILNLAKDCDFIPHKRPEGLCTDTASIRPVLIDLAKSYSFKSDDIIVMLYLTYPERTWQDIEAALKFFNSNGAKSLLCKKNIIGVHPFLMMFEQGLHGKQLFSHDLYRRQDYPYVFELSHYIFICRVDELEQLNKNLYNSQTIFFPIENNCVDVDTLFDWENFKNKINGEIK